MVHLKKFNDRYAEIYKVVHNNLPTSSKLVKQCSKLGKMKLVSIHANRPLILLDNALTLRASKLKVIAWPKALAN